MGAFWSVAGTKGERSEHKEVSLGETCKRQRMSALCYEDNLRLIPSLPDEIAIQIFARLPRVCYLNMRLVARNWKAVIMSPELFHLRKELGMTEQWLYLLTKFEDDKLLWHALDPLSKKWQRLPPIPNVVYEEESRKGLYGLWNWNMVGQANNLADMIRGWLGNKHASEQLPFCGCAIGSVEGCLYVLGGFSKTSAMRCVWRYDPIVNAWSEVNPMSTGRAYCRTSILNNKLYVVGGVSRGQGGLDPLQSAEVFDPHAGTWSQVPSMPFSKAQVLPAAFLADMLRPIATGMTSYRGKLCVPQSLYAWPFFVDVGGEMYDPETNSWDEMPVGMGEGWPARQAGTKLSIVVDGELYTLDPSSSPNSGKIKVYDVKEDAWKVVIEKVPIRDFSESESPYLLAGFHGKLHIITKDANRNIVVLQADVCNDMESSSSSSSFLASSLDEHLESRAESETVVWKVIATTNFGSAELISVVIQKVALQVCLVLLPLPCRMSPNALHPSELEIWKVGPAAVRNKEWFPTSSNIYYCRSGLMDVTHFLVRPGVTNESRTGKHLNLLSLIELTPHCWTTRENHRKTSEFTVRHRVNSTLLDYPCGFSARFPNYMILN